MGNSNTPRWGSEDRDRKAIAILNTITCLRGRQSKKSQWLDIGCGNGGIATTLAMNGINILGIDPDPWPSWDVEIDARSNLKFIVGEFDKPLLPVQANHFDVIICNQVYEHVQDPGQLIENIHKALRPSGVCYFAGPNVIWPIEPHINWPFIHWLPRRLALRIMDIVGSKRLNDLDAFSLDYWQLIRLFKLAGFKWENGIKRRLLCSLRNRTLIKWVKLVPESIFRFLTPITPGFVFFLKRTGPDPPLISFDSETDQPNRR